MNVLLDSICKAGLNRARIHDALADIEEYDGVTGHMVFDPNQKNVAPMYLGTVHDGAITYRVATMEKTPSAPQRCCRASGVCRTAGALCARGRGWRRLRRPAHQRSSARAGSAWFSSGRTQRSGTVGRVQAELAAAAAKGRAWKLVPVASDQNWGAASTQLVHALMDEHALAIVALDRDSAHLAEQLALKAFVPVVALSSDKKLTSTNIPWIFRLPPETTPAAALGLLEAAASRSGANRGAAEGRAGLGRLDLRGRISADRRTARAQLTSAVTSLPIRRECQIAQSESMPCREARCAGSPRGSIRQCDAPPRCPPARLSLPR